MHNYNHFHAQTESVAGPTNKNHHKITKRTTEKRYAQGFSAFDNKQMDK
jgi:hypothetical protein